MDTRDALMLMQHLAGWDVVVNMEAADVNEDAVVDMQDVLVLLKKQQ